MLRKINQAGPNSYYNLESHWRSLLHRDPNVKIQVDIEPHYPPGSKVPDRIAVHYQIDGGPEETDIFIND